MQKFLCACRRGFLCFLICFLVSTLFSQKIYAHKITPSDVFQATEELRLRLDALGLIDMHEYGAKKYDDASAHTDSTMFSPNAITAGLVKPPHSGQGTGSTGSVHSPFHVHAKQ